MILCSGRSTAADAPRRLRRDSRSHEPRSRLSRGRCQASERPAGQRAPKHRSLPRNPRPWMSGRPADPFALHACKVHNPLVAAWGYRPCTRKWETSRSVLPGHATPCLSAAARAHVLRRPRDFFGLKGVCKAVYCTSETLRGGRRPGSSGTRQPQTAGAGALPALPLGPRCAVVQAAATPRL